MDVLNSSFKNTNPEHLFCPTVMKLFHKNDFKILILLDRLTFRKVHKIVRVEYNSLGFSQNDQSSIEDIIRRW